jgi:acetyltransferase-like isoleucine patch superfamily enzyme
VDPLELYQRVRAVRDLAFSRAVRGSFAGFGPGSIVELPLRVNGREAISIGARVFIGHGSWLHVRPPGHLEIGDGCRMSAHCVLSSVSSVRLGRSVLLGSNVYISDNDHGHSEPKPVMDQDLVNVAPVEIGEGAWLAQNVVVLPGVTIGEGAVIGANSVVRSDIPAGAVAVGAPARVVG